MRKNKHRDDSDHYRSWLKKSHEDLRAAHVLKYYADDVNELSAFHCHQCIEKALKAYLIKRTGRRYDGHNLTFLCREAQKTDPRFFDWLDESAALNRLYIETRYPADMPADIDSDRLFDLYNMAHDMYVFIDKQLNSPPYTAQNKTKTPFAPEENNETFDI